MFRSEREAKEFYSSPAVAWFLPFIVAVSAGLFSSYLVGIITWAYVDSQRAFITALVTFGVVAFLVWARVTWIVFGKVDLVQPRPRTVIIQWKEGKNLRFAHFDSVDEKDLEVIAYHISNGGSLSIRNLRAFMGDDEKRVITFRLDLVRRGLAMFDDQNKCELTEEGTNFFESYNLSPAEVVSDA